MPEAKCMEEFMNDNPVVDAPVSQGNNLGPTLRAYLQ